MSHGDWRTEGCSHPIRAIVSFFVEFLTSIEGSCVPDLHTTSLLYEYGKGLA